MGKPSITEWAWSDDKTEALFATLGRYWIIFQWVEGLLDQLLLMAWGHENWEASQKKLARMTNEKKVDALEKLVRNSPVFATSRARPQFMAQLEAIIEDLHAERAQRNQITHAQFLFDFADKGLAPPMASTRRKTDGSFAQTLLSEQFQQKLLADIARISWNMRILAIQLTNDFQAER